MTDIMMKYIRVTLLLTFILLAHYSVEAKQYYRYIDGKGHFIVLDYLTQEALETGYDVINEDGKVINKVPPVKTIGEIEKEKQEQKDAEKEKQEQKKQLKKDVELLKLFASVNDIVRAKNAQLKGIEQRNEINENEKLLLIDNLKHVQKQAAGYERTGSKIPDQLNLKISQLQKQIKQRERNQEVIRQEKEVVSERFEKDIIRFKELQARRLVHRIENSDSSNAKNNVAVYTCKNNEECNKVWQLAQVYAKNNATGKLEIITDTLILTSAPVQDADISLAFSKIPGKSQAQVILEISCAETDAGNRLCYSNEVTKVRDGFIKLVEEKL